MPRAVTNGPLIGVPQEAQTGIRPPGATDGFRIPLPRRGAGLEPAVGAVGIGLVVAPIGEVGIHADAEPGLAGANGAATGLAEIVNGEKGFGAAT